MTPADLTAAKRHLQMSDARLAEATGIGNARTIRRYRTGETKISESFAIIIDLMLNCPAALGRITRRMNKEKDV